MKSINFKTTALALAFIFGGSVYANTTIARAAHNALRVVQQAETVTIVGQLTSGDDKGLTVTDSSKAEHKVGVTESTKVTKGGKDASFSDLKMNDQVTVVAAKASDGSLMASSIDITAE
jgi:hypothetical protein